MSDDICSHGRPDHQELVRQVREAAGMFAGAMPITPKEAFERALVEIRRLKTDQDRLPASLDRMWKDHQCQRPDLEAIVRGLAQVDPYISGGNAPYTCITCTWAEVDTEAAEHEPWCAWRQAKEWVARHPSDAGGTGV